MTAKLPGNLIHLLYFFSAVPGTVHALGVKSQISDDTSTVAWALLFFGICIFASGVMIIRNKQFGPEEGMRGNYLKGDKAIFWGLLQFVFGLVIIGFGEISLIF